MTEPRPRITHELKTWPEFFQPTLNAHKRFELRRDRPEGFQVGDQLLLKEWDPNMTLHSGDSTAERYTGREVLVRVDYVMPAETIQKLIGCGGPDEVWPNGKWHGGFVIMSISRVE